MRYPFVALEGCDGAGKTTVRQALNAALRSNGTPCTMVGQHAELDVGLTRIIIDVRERRRHHPPAAIADAYFRDKQLHAACNIVPALDRALLIADRYVFSDAVYQEVLYGIPAEETLERHRKAGTPMPDAIVHVELPVDEANRRIERRGRPRRHYERPADLGRIADVYDRVLRRAPPPWLPSVLVFSNDEADCAGRVRDELVPAVLALR
jgi:thymidylate kinase